MYVPKYAENKEISSIIDFIKHHAFGILVSHSAHKMVATHLPLEFSPDNKKLFGHISRANQQWKNFEGQPEVLAIFTGPHAYISSSWYDHENVPTWNYIAAHVYGKISIIEGEELYQSLTRLTDKYEAASSRPVSVNNMTPEYVRKSIQGLVGFEIAITNIEATFKLSQNRDQKNFQSIIHELEKRQDEGSLQVASEMRRTTNEKH
jgi:transcriptional regulator